MGRSETAFSVVIIWFTAVFIFSACKLIRSKIGRVLLLHAHSPERGNSFSKPGKNRSLKIQLSPLVRPCFKAEKTPAQNWSVGLFSRASIRNRQPHRTGKTALQALFILPWYSFLIQQNKTRQEAKQNPLITQPEPGFPLPCFSPVCEKWHQAKPPFSLCSIGCRTQLWGLHSKPLLTLILLILPIEGFDFKSGPVAILLWSGFAIAIPAIFATRRCAFQTQSSPQSYPSAFLILPWSCRSCFAGYG